MLHPGRGVYVRPMQWLVSCVLGLLAAGAPALLAAADRAIGPASTRVADSRVVSNPAAPAAAVDDRSGRVALVIGNAAYKVAPRLNTPIADARAVCKRLADFGFDVECVENTDTRDHMQASIARFAARMRAGGVALFYFAGHGVQRHGENFLLPVNARVEHASDLNAEGLALGHLMTVVGETKPGLNLVIIDACRDNLGDDVQRLALPRGFAAIDAPPSTMVLYSTSPGRLALDQATGVDARHSPFAAELLRALSAGEAPLEELFKAVAAGVQKSTRGRQVPWMNSSFTGNFCFGVCSNVPSAAELARLTAEKQEVERRLRELELERNRRDNDVSAVAARVRQLERSIQLGHEELARLRTAGLERTAAFAEAGARLKFDIESFEMAKSHLAAANDRADSQRVEARRLESLASDLDNRLAEIERLRTDNAQLRRKTEQLHKEVGALQERSRAEGGRPAGRAPPPPPAF